MQKLTSQGSHEAENHEVVIINHHENGGLKNIVQ
jgi:hypothetical protein